MTFNDYFFWTTCNFPTDQDFELDRPQLISSFFPRTTQSHEPEDGARPSRSNRLHFCLPRRGDVELDEVLLHAAHEYSAVAAVEEDAVHVNHVFRRVGEDGDAASDLRSQRGVGQGEDALVGGENVPHLVSRVHLKRGVLLQLRAVVRGHVAALGPGPQELLVAVERQSAHANLLVLLNPIADYAVQEVELVLGQI